jgi:hypothetical protein
MALMTDPVRVSYSKTTKWPKTKYMVHCSKYSEAAKDPKRRKEEEGYPVTKVSYLRGICEAS